MNKRITVAFTLPQLRALEWIAAYGADEKHHVLDELADAYGYSASEAAEQRRDLRTSENAIAVLQGAMRKAAQPQPCYTVRKVYRFVDRETFCIMHRTKRREALAYCLDPFNLEITYAVFDAADTAVADCAKRSEARAIVRALRGQP